MPARTSTPSLVAGFVVAAALALLAPSPALAAGETDRQADFARQELSEGKFDRALKSAESALRLDPIFYEALGLKALAYEGLGQLRLAESLLLTWMEMAGRTELPAPYDAALVRIRAQMEDQQQRRQGQRGRVIELDTEPVPVVVEIVASDPQIYRQRSQEALEAGQCHGAMSAATELVQVDPEGATGHRLLGDAHRCQGELPRAARAYRRSLAIDGEQEAVADLLADLTTMLASLEVQVSLTDDKVVPLMQLELDGERIDPGFRDRSVARFEDLPTGLGALLVVAGRGLRPETHDLEPLAPAEARTFTVSPQVVGLGTVVLGDFDPDTIKVTLQTPDEDLVSGPGQSWEVTADDVHVTVTTELGAVELPLGLVADESLRFEPSKNLPAGLTLSGVPAGSSVTVIVEGRSGAVTEQARSVPPELGSIDPETGLRLAPPLPIDSLLGGKAGVWLEHPVLGSANQEVVLEGGAWSAALIDLGGLDGVAAITSRWQEWSRAEAPATPQAVPAVTGVLGGLLLAGGATALGLSQVAADRRIRPGLVCEALGPDADSCVEAASLKTQQEALIGSGIAGLGLGVASVSLTIGLGVRGKKGHRASSGWDPWAEASPEGGE